MKRLLILIIYFYIKFKYRDPARKYDIINLISKLTGRNISINAYSIPKYINRQASLSIYSNWGKRIKEFFNQLMVFVYLTRISIIMVSYPIFMVLYAIFIPLYLLTYIINTITKPLSKLLRLLICTLQRFQLEFKIIKTKVKLKFTDELKQNNYINNRGTKMYDNDIYNNILYLSFNCFFQKVKFLNNNLEIIFKKFNLFIIISMSLWFLLKDKLDALISFIRSNEYISKIKIKEIPILFPCIAVLLCIAYFYPKYKRKYVYSRKIITIYTCLIIIYYYYRFISNKWIFCKPIFNIESIYDTITILVFVLLVFIISFKNTTYFSVFKKIIYFIFINIVSTYYLLSATICKHTWSAAYLDIIFIIYLYIIIITLNKYHSYIRTYNNYNNSNSLLLGEAIEKEEDDILDFNDIAAQLARQICKLNNNKSFAIGITKHWGNGKSTFLNFLKTHIEKNNRPSIIIDFSPWYCKTEIDIINLFFKTLAENLKPHHRSINNEISKYAKQILALKKNALTEYLAKGFNFLSDSTDIKDIYDRINKNIGFINKKVYIIIDDIDRLQAKEILECLKIIRNTANFQNIVFVVAYDPTYVDIAIRKGLRNNTKGYMDKIIQLPFELPEIEKYKIKEYIKNKLETSGISKENVKEILFPSYNKIPYIFQLEERKGHIDNKTLNISNYFNNIRDCNKVLNIFFIYKSLINSEVVLSELFLTCILKTLYPEEARILYNNIEQYFTFSNDINYIGTSIKKVNEYEIEKYKKQLENQKIEGDYYYYKIKDISNSEYCLSLISAIFFKKNPTEKSVALNNNYYTYYNGVVSTEKIRYDKFKIYIQSCDKIKEVIENFKENDSLKFEDLLYKLQTSTPTETKSASIIALGLLYYASDSKKKYINQCNSWFEKNNEVSRSFFYDIKEEITNELDSFILFEQIKYRDALVDNKNKKEIEEKLIKQQIKQSPESYFNSIILYNFCTYCSDIKDNTLIPEIKTYITQNKLLFIEYLFKITEFYYDKEYSSFQIGEGEYGPDWDSELYIILHLENIKFDGFDNFIEKNKNNQYCKIVGEMKLDKFADLIKETFNLA